MIKSEKSNISKKESKYNSGISLKEHSDDTFYIEGFVSTP